MNPTETPISWPMKVVFWFVAVNALLGAGSLLLFPTRTDTLFFWKITPPINAALFGALYLGGAIAVAQAMLRDRWETARYLIPVLVTAGALLSLTTFLHLDRFIPGIRLYYWLVIYIGAPVLASAFYLQHERRGATWQVVEQPVTWATRTLAVAMGTLIALFGSIGLARPELITALAPWPISPLMARVFAAWFSAFVPALLWFWWEPDWNRLYPVANLMIAAAGLDLVMIFIHQDDLTPGAPTMWLVVASLLGLGLVATAMHWLQRQSAIDMTQP